MQRELKSKHRQPTKPSARLALPKTDELVARLRLSSDRRSNEKPSEPLVALQELGALVISAGIEAGFVVFVEAPVKINRPRGKPQRGKVDCCWYALDRDLAFQPVVAWEFDGRDVAKSHVAGSKKKRRIGTIEKLRKIAAPLKYQALYSYRDRKELGPQSRTAKKALQDESIAIVDCGQLLREDFLAGIAEAAMTEARRLGLTLLSASATQR